MREWDWQRVKEGGEREEKRAWYREEKKRGKFKIEGTSQREERERHKKIRERERGIR